MSSAPFVPLANATAIPWLDLPEMAPGQLVEATAAQLQAGLRLCAWFAVPEPASHPTESRLVAVLADDAGNTLLAGRSSTVRGVYPAKTPGAYPALTIHAAEAHLFEREVREQHGLTPLGHPWLKPVRRPGVAGDAPAMDAFFQVAGGEVHEVAVGPVHAGVIEPGHFRFQCAGEEVLHLEIALGYQHRGLEESLAGGPHAVTPFRIEAVAGDASIAHATAHALVIEALAGSEAPLRAQWLRAIALELERLANHTGDLGALANDVAFLPTAAACGRIRGDFLNLTALLCGNRFGRGLVRPGGCRHDVDTRLAATLVERLRIAAGEVERAAAWLWDSATVRGRFEGTGVVTDELATEIGMVGPAARASGLVRDVRYDHPAGWHRFAQIPVAVWPGGDVLARARVRALEAQRSAAFVAEQLAAGPDGPIRQETGALAGEMLAIALVEGWRGETCHVALTDRDGRFRRYKIVDPSFHNWTGLAMALRGQAISDFPLCNKSFNLSYCGFDL